MLIDFVYLGNAFEFEDHCCKLITRFINLPIYPIIVVLVLHIFLDLNIFCIKNLSLTSFSHNFVTVVTGNILGIHWLTIV